MQPERRVCRRVFHSTPPAQKRTFFTSDVLISERPLDPLVARDRILFGSTAGSLLMIYALWRWHDTLPAFAFSVQTLWEYFFFVFEALAIVYTLMSIVIL